MRRAAKIDLNQKEIVLQLRMMGYTVRHTHTIGKGFPDIVIGRASRNLLVEIKRKGESLTPDEREFFETWKGAVIIGYDAEQIHNEFAEQFDV